MKKFWIYTQRETGCGVTEEVTDCGSRLTWEDFTSFQSGANDVVLASSEKEAIRKGRKGKVVDIFTLEGCPKPA